MVIANTIKKAQTNSKKTTQFPRQQQMEISDRTFMLIIFSVIMGFMGIVFFQLKADINQMRSELKTDINRVEDRMSRVEDRISRVENKADQILLRLPK